MFSLLSKTTPPPDPKAPLVKLEEVYKTYTNGAMGLQGINLTLKRGEFLWIAGVSGAGKSTLLKLLYGAERPTAGKVWVDHQSVNSLSSRQLAQLRRRIGVVFQDYKLLPKHTVAENVSFVLKTLGYGQGEIRRRLWPTLRLVGLESKADCFPHQLSGGEQQRVGIARAIVHTPLLLLADEPTGNLDARNMQMTLGILDELHQAGVSIIVTSHDEALIKQTSHTIVTLDQGRLLPPSEGMPAALKKKPESL